MPHRTHRVVASFAFAAVLVAVTAGPASAAVKFAPYQSYFVGSWPSSVAIGDFNHDGRNDVAMSTGYYFDPTNDFKLFVWSQRSNGTLVQVKELATQGVYGDPMGLGAGDLN